MNQRHPLRYVLYGLILAWLLAFLVWPILLTVSGGFRDPQGGLTLDYLWLVFENPLYRQGLVNSLLIAVFTTILTLLIALPLAVASVRFEFPGKALLSSLILVPLILPPFVGAIGMRALLGRFGALNGLLANMGLLDPNAPGIDFLGGAVGGRFLSVVVMEALHLYPILFLNVTAALANLDPTLNEAAQNLGASRWTRFRRVTLPLILPGIFAGGTIVFVWSLTELGTPLMFDYKVVTPVQIFYGAQEISDNPQPYALTVVMLAMAILCYLAGKLAFGGRAYAMEGKATVSSTAARLTGWKGWGLTAAFAGIIGLAILPHISVILSSFTVDGAWYRSVLPTEWTTAHYEGMLQHPLAIGGIFNSLIYASLAMVACVVVGVAIAYLNARLRVKGGALLDTLAMLPLAVPGLVMAFGYVAMTVNFPLPQMRDFFNWIGANELASLLTVSGTAPNPILLLVVAYSIRRLPYVVRAASAGLEQTSGALEEAAQNLGANTLYTLRRVVVPLIAANLIAAAILVFSFSMLEVSDSLILTQSETDYPITKAIYVLFSRLGDGPYIASALGVWSMALLTVTLVGAGLIMGRKLGAIFRV